MSAKGMESFIERMSSDLETGKLEFLEINTMPMFTGYDDVSQGKLLDAMLQTLIKLSPLSFRKKDHAPVL